MGLERLGAPHAANRMVEEAGDDANLCQVKPISHKAWYTSSDHAKLGPAASAQQSTG